MTATIVRPLNGRIEIRSLRAPLGDEPSNKSMFKSAAGRSIRPKWVKAAEGQPGWKGHWEIARKHLSDVAQAVAIRDGEVWIEMHYSTTEKCDKRCQEAVGDDCTCACEGKYHGEGEHAAWVQVGDTTLVSEVGAKIVTRKLTREQATIDRDARTDAMIQEMISRARSVS